MRSVAGGALKPANPGALLPRPLAAMGLVLGAAATAVGVDSSLVSVGRDLAPWCPYGFIIAYSLLARSRSALPDGRSYYPIFLRA